MIYFKNVSKVYGEDDYQVNALDKVSFEIDPGAFTIILGPSGSGKSTLLNILGGMDRLTSGEFYYNDKDISTLNDNELSEFRKDVIGFVFQFYNLIPSLTAYENIAIAADLNDNLREAEQLLSSVGLTHRKNNFPTQLSGGEMQRVSIARALAKKPKLLLCDEPTGALDSETGSKILNILRDVTKEDTAVVMVTHNEEFVPYADKVIRLSDGKIHAITQHTPTNLGLEAVL
jgi:putative ABC transport system ATP-binding protein